MQSESACLPKRLSRCQYLLCTITFISSAESAPKAIMWCAVMHNLALEGLLDGGLKFRPMTLPDRFIEHGGQGDQLAEAGLSASHIAATALTLLGRKKDSVALLENGWTLRA